MTDERKEQIIKTMANRSKEELVKLLELYAMGGTNDSTEEYAFVWETIRNEILSRMSH